jgi:hypothetical protein
MSKVGLSERLILSRAFQGSRAFIDTLDALAPSPYVYVSVDDSDHIVADLIAPRLISTLSVSPEFLAKASDSIPDIVPIKLKDAVFWLHDPAVDYSLYVFQCGDGIMMTCAKTADEARAEAARVLGVDPRDLKRTRMPRTLNGKPFLAIEPGELDITVEEIEDG